MKQKAGVLQGTLDLMVLQTLAMLGPLHGYAIAGRIEQVSSGAIQLNMGIALSRPAAAGTARVVRANGTAPRRIGARSTTASRLPAAAN